MSRSSREMRQVRGRDEEQAVREKRGVSTTLRRSRTVRGRDRRLGPSATERDVRRRARREGMEVREGGELEGEEVQSLQSEVEAESAEAFPLVWTAGQEDLAVMKRPKQHRDEVQGIVGLQ